MLIPEDFFPYDPLRWVFSPVPRVRLPSKDTPTLVQLTPAPWDTVARMGATCLRSLLLASFVTLACFGQPGIFSVVNAASHSNGPIAQGSIFTVLGFSLGPDELVPADPASPPFELAGTSIQITVGGNRFDCPMISTSYSQVSAILPSNTPIGDAILTLSSDEGVVDRPTYISVAASSFGIYSTAGSGLGPGMITDEGGALKSFDQPAVPGDVLIARGTGLGAIDGGDSSPPATSAQFPNVEVFVGNSSAIVTSAGRSQCCAGQDDVAFQVPDSTFGCFVPVAVRTGGTTVSNFVTLSISASGEPCSSAPPGLPVPLLRSAIGGEPLNLGIVAIGPQQFLEFMGFSFVQDAVNNLSALLHKPVAEADVKLLIQAYRAGEMRKLQQILAKYGIRPRHVDRRLVRALRAAAGVDQQGVAAGFGTFTALSDFTTQIVSNFPPAPMCMLAREVPGPLRLPQSPHSKSLDAGAALAFSGPAGQIMMPRRAGEYQASLGGGFQNAIVSGGSYSVAGPGGSDVAPFTALLNIPNTFAWTNKSAISSVDRTQPLTLTWSGGPSEGYVLIGAIARSNHQAAVLLCTESSDRGSFTIPDFALSALPAADASAAFLFVAPHPFSNPVTIPGLDFAYFVNMSSDYEAVEFR